MKPPVSRKEEYNSIRAVAYDDERNFVVIENLDDISDFIEGGRHIVWLDLPHPSSEQLDLLGREFGIHPVAIDDVALRHERPKIEFFDRYVTVVAHAASLDDNDVLVTHEVAIIAGERYVVTIRADPLFGLDEVKHRWHVSQSIARDSTGLLYMILDTIVDGYFPLTEEYDDRLDRLEAKLFEENDKTYERTEHEIFRFKRALTTFRAIVVPMREVLNRLSSKEIAPLDPTVSIYFRDANDHVIRALEQIDITRDLVNSTLDIHLATQTHRQNEVSKQLTIIATIFLPLTYITGFFGQNFGWMVNNIVSPQMFWYLGVGSQVLTVIFLFWYFRHRRWF